MNRYETLEREREKSVDKGNGITGHGNGITGQGTGIAGYFTLGNPSEKKAPKRKEAVRKKCQLIAYIVQKERKIKT